MRKIASHRENETVNERKKSYENQNKQHNAQKDFDVVFVFCFFLEFEANIYDHRWFAYLLF